jgi:hypothetical protein
MADDAGDAYRRVSVKPPRDAHAGRGSLDPQVGRQIRLFWTAESKWFEGVVEDVQKWWSEDETKVR